MGLDAALLLEATEARERLLDRQHAVEQARADYHHAIRRLHAAGGSMREIAEKLDVSHQRVHQVVDEGAGDGGRRGPVEALRSRIKGRLRKSVTDAFQRFTRRARDVVVHAQEEAHALGHAYIGTEHLLLGVLRGDEGIAAVALRKLGVSLEGARAAVVEIVGEGPDRQQRGRVPFTPRSKKVLELSLHEARALRHNYIGTEHLLLAISAEREGVGSKVLEQAGADEAKVRAALMRLLAG